MTDSQGAAKAAPSNSIVTWVRSLDMRWVAFILSGLAALAHGIVSGELPLAHLAPASWDDSIKAYCGLYLYVFPLLIGAHSATAINWPKVQTVAKVLILALALGALFVPQARAQDQAVHRTVRHKILARVPLPIPDPRLAGLYDTTSSKTKLTAQQVTQNPLLLLQQFSVSDIQNAIKLAQSQNPPDQTALTCWNALLPIVQSLPTGTSSSSSTSGNAAQLGIATGIQDERDVQQLISNLQSNSGPLAALNTACAPLVVQIQTTLTMLGIAGGVVASGGAPAAATATAALQALLTTLKLP